MPGTPAEMNLTRAEARERARLLKVESYDVRLDLTTSETTFRSETAVRFGCEEPGAGTFIDLAAESVLEIELNGVRLDPATAVTGARIALSGLAADNTVRVVAECAYSRTGEGLHRFTDPVDGSVYLYTQHEPRDAMRVFSCFDQPDLKATFQLTVAAPADWQVVSNSPTPEPQPVSDGVARWGFAPTARISTYITALVAGPYYSVRDEYVRADGSTIPLGVFCRASLGQYLDPDEILEVTKQGFAFFEEQYGRPYPFAKYDQLFVPEFNAGAMENAGCVTFLEDMVFRSKVTDASRDARANTILHEMAHMWFGDLVTMRWWDDLWLNESFAEFMAYHSAAEATRFTGSWTGFATGRKAWGYRQDQLPSTHPIAADAPDLETAKQNFDGITYAKGASVLRQLVAWVGVEPFMAGVRTYMDRHAWQNTTLGDLLSELERESGRDLSAWSKEWLETAGCNTLRPAFTVGPDGSYAEFAVAQEAPSDYPTLRSHRIGVGLYDRAGDRLVLRDRVELDLVGAVTEVPQLVGVGQPDLLLLNDGDLTFAKIRLDDRSLHTATTSLAALDDSLTRALLWAAAWDMTRDAEMSATDFLELVVRGVAAESDLVTVGTILRQAKLVIDQFAHPSHRPDLVRRVAAAFFGLLQEAEPASDHQLAFARAFANFASTPDELEAVRGLLDGSAVPDGLALDPDLRWPLLGRLIATGAEPADAIEAELARDATSSGERYAAALRAAVPSAEAKAGAWAKVVDADLLPNAMQTATIGGFQQADQLDLLRPYAARFFTQVPDVWASRTTEMASNITVGLFPALLVEQQTADLAEAFLQANPDLNPAARRLVAEGRDGVLRAMRARACDAG